MPEPTSIQPVIGPAKARDIEYSAFARDFGGGDVVLRLMEKEPVIHYDLATYQVASWTPGQPLADTPEQIIVTDGHGAHTVDVEAWAAPSS